MATPVFACGAECGIDNTFGHLNSSQNYSFSTTTVRSGLRSLRHNPTAALGSSDVMDLPSTTDWVVRAYVRFATLPDVTSRVFALGSPVAQGIYFNVSDSKLYVGSAVGTLGATGVSITTGVWYRLDFKGTATTLDAQIDGVAVGQLTGTFAAKIRLIFGDDLTNNTRDQFTDDILISQTSTDYPLGAGFVKSYIPNADGTHNVAGANDFEVSLGGVDITNSTTDAYTLLDERPLPTTAVDFVNGKAPPNATDYVEWQYEDST